MGNGPPTYGIKSSFAVLPLDQRCVSSNMFEAVLSGINSGSWCEQGVPVHVPYSAIDSVHVFQIVTQSRESSDQARSVFVEECDVTAYPSDTYKLGQRDALNDALRMS